MKWTIILIMGSALLFVGCSEEKKTFENYGDTLIKQTERTRTVESQAQLQTLRSAVMSFKAMEGRNPSSLDELVEKRFISQLPTPPRGKRYVYDAGTGEVGLEG